MNNGVPQSLKPAQETRPKWVSELQNPQLWGDGSEPVELVETHISWVILTRRFAFKVKKPVAFDFLDFRTLAARKAACEDEVRLNRRLARNVYLGVATISESADGQLCLGITDAIVDYAVKMVRLPTSARLDVRMRKKSLTARETDSLIRTLYDFYYQTPPLTLRPEEQLRRTVKHIYDNRQALREAGSRLPSELIDRATSAQLMFLKIHSKLLADRVRDGRLIEGHGDLRPEHIYLTREPAIIDCIEFSAAFRQLDVADELCFLAMECDTLGATEIGQQILTRTLESLGDCPHEQLLAFYKSYRATVRAKVAALRACQQSPSQQNVSLQEARRDLQMAAAYLALWIPPLVIVVAGLMGSGKSTLAAALAEECGFVHLQTDAIRQELLGSVDTGEAFGAGKYSRGQRDLVYRQLFDRAAFQLSQGLSVVLDGTFLRRELRDGAASLARQNGAESMLAWCVCPANVAKSRIAARRLQGEDSSQARPELRAEQLLEAELPSVEEESLEIDTTAAWPLELAQIYSRLADKLEGSANH